MCCGHPRFLRINTPLFLASFLYIYNVSGVINLFGIAQVDVDYKLQDMKKAYKELEMKEKGYKKMLDDLHIAFLKHMEQYASILEYAFLCRSPK